MEVKLYLCNSFIHIIDTKETMWLFYKEDIALNQITALSKEEALHCTKVLRLKEGDTIFLTNGKGSLFEGTISSCHKDECLVALTSEQTDYQKRDYYIHIAIAPTKNPSRMEWFIEKAVEMGVDEITPLICQHSQRTSIKTERWEKIAIAAAKQSLKCYLPKINEETAFDSLVTKTKEQELYIAYCAQDIQYTTLKKSYTKGQSIIILIGPEGDFAKEEIALAMENKFKPLTFGSERLRTETAAIYAVASIHFLNND